jgi:ubiquinone/menaquinone biosynthesis C-methylase UbiE
MIVEALKLESGMKVVEIGCGPGTFTIDIARAIQPDGVVYAVDIQDAMLDQLRANMDRNSIDNIVPILADAGGRIPIEDGFADAAFGVTVLPEIPDKISALQEIKRVLRIGGLFADAELVIDPDWPLRRTVKKWAEQVQLEFSHELGHALRYVLVFRKVND